MGRAPRACVLDLTSLPRYRGKEVRSIFFSEGARPSILACEVGAGTQMECDPHRTAVGRTSSSKHALSFDALSASKRAVSFECRHEGSWLSAIRLALELG